MDEKSRKNLDLKAANLKAAILKLLENDDSTQAKIAKEADISGAALSQWLKGEYKGNNATIGAKIEKWLQARIKKNEKRASFPQAPEWVDTSIYKRIESVLSYTHIAGNMAVIYGSAGVGKTHSLKHYAMFSPNVWLVTITPSVRSLAEAVSEIAYSVGIRNVSGRPAKISRDIIRRIRGSNGLLIIDEAQHLSITALEEIRSYPEETGIGVVLCGNEIVYSRLTGGNRGSNFAQLFSRLGKRLRINKPYKNDAINIAKAFGVEGDKEFKVICDIASKPGGLRGLVYTLQLASIFAAGSNEEINAKNIMAAWKDLSVSEI